MGNPDEISDFQFQGFSDFVALQTLASFAIWDFKIKKINIIFINLKSTFLVKVPILLHNKQDGDEDGQVWFHQVTGLNVRSEYIPFIIGTFASITLILVLLLAYVLWHCCISTNKKNVQESTKIETIEKNLPNNLNYSTIFAGSKNGSNNSRIIELIPEHDGSLRWFYKNHTFLRKQNDINKSQQRCPLNSSGDNDMIKNRNQGAMKFRSRSRSIILSPVTTLEEYSLPPISEFCVHPCKYMSNSLTDGGFATQNPMNIRTRSLPSCVKHKKHSLAAADSAIELYDKVNFSKKRKNRMRNNEAAIIALSKSQSQFFNKDTDNLVDNEAVIVYDERTAL
ncbi:hypothetical protein V9T40_009340 [Parthenolecanium corni]|uniref:Uncharacterized protein n=1 Tax=Parthenolecanium corni TaxID=536013 RepID=A0AAN9TMI6_9HEMI